VRRREHPSLQRLVPRDSPRSMGRRIQLPFYLASPLLALSRRLLACYGELDPHRVFPDGHGHPAGDGGWYWQRNFPQSSSARGQRVLDLFANWQKLDSATKCGAIPANGAGDSEHLMILRFREDLVPRVVEAFALSTVSGRWYGAGGIAPAAGPIQLFSLCFPGIPPGVCPNPIRTPIGRSLFAGPPGGARCGETGSDRT
jgi:hypothetical protein